MHEIYDCHTHGADFKVQDKIFDVFIRLQKRAAKKEPSSSISVEDLKVSLCIYQLYPSERPHRASNIHICNTRFTENSLSVGGIQHFGNSMSTKSFARAI